MKNSNIYSARLTGNPFLFFELKTTARLVLKGLSKQEIGCKVRKENLFQYKTTKSIVKRLNAVFLRLDVLDDTLLKLLVNASSQTGKIIALYTIMKTDQLFYEFMQEEFRTKYLLHVNRLQRVDLVSFFARKSEQSPTVAAWKDNTIKELIRVYISLLVDSKLLEDAKNLVITAPVIEPILKQHLKKNGEEQYIQAMLGGS